MIIKNINLTIHEGPLKENQHTLDLHIRFLDRETDRVNRAGMINCY